MYSISLVTFLLSVSLFLGMPGTFPSMVNHDGKDTKWHDLKEAQKLAKAYEKKVLVYVYAHDSKQCQRMSYRVYSSEAVSDIIHEHFFASKINAKSDDTIQFNGEKMTESTFADKFNVSSYPTIIFLDSEGQVITLQGGFIEKETFTKLLVYVGTDAYKRQEFDQFTYRRNN